MDEKAGNASTLEQLRATAATLESQRAILGDQAVDTALAAIRTQIATLEDSPAPTKKRVAGDEVEGDKVGGDKVAGDKTESTADRVTIHYGQEMDDKAPLQAYLATVARRSARLPLGPLDPSGQESAYISLAQVFVGLDAGNFERRILADAEGKFTVLERFSASLAHIHENRRLILLGDPGSGKSTLLRFLALCLTQTVLHPEGEWLNRLHWLRQRVQLDGQEFQPDTDLEPAREMRTGTEKEAEEAEVYWTAEVPIPIFVTLRDFAQDNFDPHSPVAIWQHIVKQLEKEDLAEAVAPLRSKAQTGQVIFLLDGVDEVAEDQRPAIWQAIAAMGDGPYGGNRWLATCRILSFAEAEAPPNVPVQTLQSLDETQIETFIASWYRALAEAGELSPEQAKNMTASLQVATRRPRLRPLAQNPMLLTIMALVQTYHGTLPDERAKLYQACVETLLLRWQRHKETTADGSLLPEPLIQLDTSQEKLERLIWEIAWTAHQETAGREEVADIPRLEVVEIAEKHLGNLAKAEAFLEYTEQRAHLLLGRGGVAGRVYAFPHRTFQEYLAACWLTTFRRFPQEAARLAEEPALWREVLLLAAGTLVFNQNNREKALDGVAGVLPDRKPNPGDEAGWSRVWLAGEMMAVVGRETAEADEVGRELLPRLREQLAALLSGGRLPPRQRAEAGDALGQLGDPRPGVCDREPEVIYLSAGTFLMGDDNHEIYLPTFAIARYPVTNAQFRTFVEDGGYTAKWRHCWTKEGWQDAFWSLDNKPVVGVSWYEAAAYAKWLSQVTGRDFRLPTEAEWERAARHTDGRTYPWGGEWQDGLVNSEESGLNRTAAVGSFPGGAAVCGAHDLSGNVWEWCSTRYRDENGQEYPTPYRLDDGREDLSGDVSIYRVLRGGAFDYDQWVMRAAVRYLFLPNYRLNYIGFRVVEHLS